MRQTHSTTDVLTSVYVCVCVNIQILYKLAQCRGSIDVVDCLPRKYFEYVFWSQVREMGHVSGWGGGDGGVVMEWTSVMGGAFVDGGVSCGGGVRWDSGDTLLVGGVTGWTGMVL
jgi:hypothetical protein